MISNTEPFYEPVNILKQLSGEYTAEMSEEQSAFLCGLLKKYRPNKIVEIGVAAGGTTAVMLNCIALLGLEAELFSIDLSENFYRDSDKKTGYLAEECKTILKRKFEHTVYTGRYAVEYIDDIGEDIDFLVLDTVHSMPGEILDFLAYCPHLKTGCVVVMHDISLNHFIDNTDGVILYKPGSATILNFADCTPVILYEPKNKVAAGLHAGWRGTADSICKKGVKLMVENFNSKPSDIIAAIAPCIGQEAFETGIEVYEKLKGTIQNPNTTEFFRFKNDKVYPDLAKINAAQLMEAGLKTIDISHFKTCKDNEFFFS